MKRGILFLAVASCILMGSCKKDDNPDENLIRKFAGTWRYAKGTEPEKYLLVNKDLTCAILSADANGIRDQNDALLLVTSQQVMIDNSDPNVYPNVSIYNYRIKGDTLSLVNPRQHMVLVREKENEAAASWITTVTAAGIFPAPVDEPTDITFDGTYLWYGNGYNSDHIFRIDPLNGETDSIPTAFYAWAVESQGNDLWISNDGSDKLEKISTTDGHSISATVEMGAWIYGIALDANYLWCFSNNENILYKYNIADERVESSVHTRGNWAGLAMVDNYLYVAANGKLHKCTTEPLAGTASYQLKGYYIFGVAYDGTSIWVSAYPVPSGKPVIIKLDGVP